MTITGSGVLLYCKKSVQIVTNRHVLFNDEEMAKATFDVFFDYENNDPNDKNKLFKRCRRRDGKVIIKTTSKYDLSLAAFEVKVEMTAHINKHCPDLTQLPRLWLHKPSQDSAEGLSIFSRTPVVCLISHPLGQAKQVSFGQALDFNPHTGILHHNAPSRPGSSGAPVLFFATPSVPKMGDCIVYHVGVEPDSPDKKIAQVEKFDYHTLEKEQTYWQFLKKRHADSYETRSIEDLIVQANASLQVATLAACAPALGAFLLLAEEFHLLGLDTALLTPCTALHSDKSASLQTLQPFVKEVICKIARVVPAFSLAPSSPPDDIPELVSLLESQGPCFCRSIVKLMERGSKSSRGTVTEAFLSPYSTAVKMFTEDDVTWPWRTRDSPGFIDVDIPDGGCLLRKCLMLCERPDGIIIPVILLHMILKANAVISHLFPDHCDALKATAPGDEKNHRETIHSWQAQTPPCGKESDGRPDNTPPGKQGTTTSPVAPLTGDWLLVAKDVLALVFFVLRFCSMRCENTDLDDYGKRLTNDEEGNSHLDMLFSRCLARSEHVFQHLKQIHPDRGRPGQEDSDTEPCPCGRPTYWDVMQAVEILLTTVENERAGELDAKHVVSLRTADELSGDHRESERMFSYRFMAYLQDAQRAALNTHPERPGRSILGYFDKLPQFTHGHDSLMISLASTEAILYNSCMLAKYVSKHLKSMYVTLPVSVYGRPGNWPGNVTPPEVQRTAWRLIQDAIVDSGFPPAVLAALDEDAERRSKLIDVYVDMKQLKWEKKILPHQFEEALRYREAFLGLNVFQLAMPFPTATCYFVYTVLYLLGGGEMVFQ